MSDDIFHADSISMGDPDPNGLDPSKIPTEGQFTGTIRWHCNPIDLVDELTATLNPCGACGKTHDLLMHREPGDIFAGTCKNSGQRITTTQLDIEQLTAE